MAEEGHEQDYNIETADAGASATIPMEAGQIKKGGYMMIKGHPCKVLNISVSKTGKHGHAKCNFTATDIFTGKKYEDMIPSTHGTTVPIVNKSEWEVIDINEDGELTLMDEGGNQKTDLNLPSFPEGLDNEIKEAWSGGENSVMVSVQSAVGIEQIIAYKKESNA
ncbi:hypothetical protein ACA910_019048 [Epithemia clementina (nom. ined.)]